MSDLIYEREYAREILFAAMRHRARACHPPGAGCEGTAEIAALIAQALDVGCGRTKLIVELANLAAWLVIPSAGDPVAPAREVPGE